MHPTFSNLFVQTEIIRQQRAILCTRRPRSLGEHPPWMFHLMAVHGADIGEISYETDRMRFIGRGGWTWYTGSAAWMYRLIVESLLGLRLEVDKLRVAPCFSADWETFKVHYRYRETVYHIAVLQTHAGNGEASVTVDGVEQPDKAIPLVDDHQEHSVEVRISAAPS